MKYIHAKKLHNGDEVTVKSTDKVETVVEVVIEDKDVFVRLNDGNLYHHVTIK